MKPHYRQLLAGLASAAVLLLAGCGGGDAAPTPPTAVAKTSHASAPIGTPITLDGSGSSSPNSGKLAYTWALSTKPDGSTAALSDAAAATPSFTPDKPGDYTVDLTVKDDKAGSTAVRLSIKVSNPDPVALVTPATQIVLQGSTVTLDGSTSLPPTGGAASELRYEWKLAEQPKGSLETRLIAANSARASFTAGKLGIYRAHLIVRHGERVSVVGQAEVSVNNGNSGPVAKISALKTVLQGSTLVLDGSASSDADGDALQYRWSFPAQGDYEVAKPRASKALISNASSAKAAFVPDAVGRYYIELTVYDNSVYSSERLIVEVTKPAGAANVKPVAVIGDGRATNECELGRYCAISADYRSYDTDNDPLSAKWTYWDTAKPTVKHSAEGMYLAVMDSPEIVGKAATWQVQLVVNDGQVDSAPAEQTVTVKIAANGAPFDVAKVDAATLMVGQNIWFDGSESSDPDGDKLSYEWTLVDRPTGSTAQLQTPNAVRASVLADKPGLYQAQLRVRDPKGAFRPPLDPVKAFAKLRNNAPVVANVSDFRADQPVVLTPYTEDGKTVVRVAVGLAALVFDPDKDYPLHYILTPTRYPLGSALEAQSDQIWGGDPADNNGYNVEGGYTVTLPGEYEFQLVASDGISYSEPKKFKLNVVKLENYPGITLGRDGGYNDGWPYARHLDSGVHELDSSFDTEPREIGSYQLYAADRDYTLADLVASSTDSAVTPYFIGLRDGQLIRKGETVVFKVVRPAIPNERAQVKHLNTGLEQGSEKHKTEYARLDKLYQSYRFTWSFRFAEKADSTFFVGPRP